MARLREYNREDVLQKATTLFWEKGYEATSMASLVEATGLNSASMYKEFGSKEGFYEAVLTYYREHWLERILKVLSDNPNMEGIKSYLSALLDSALKPGFKGCLMVNTIAEVDTVGKGAMARVEKFCVRLQSLLENAIYNAQQQGDIPGEKKPQALASYIVCLMHGLVLYGRIEDNKKNVPEIVDMVMENIKG